MRDHLLSIVLLSPLLGAAVLLIVPGGARRALRAVALLSSLPPLLICLALPFLYDTATGGFQFLEIHPVIPSLGIDYRMAVDGLSVALMMLTAVIYLTAITTSWYLESRQKEFFLFLALLVTGVFGVFASLDLFLFFLFYELAVLPMYVLIGVWGSSMEIEGRGPFAWTYRAVRVGIKEYGAMKLTLYLLAGSAFILVGLFMLYIEGGKALPPATFDFVALQQVEFGTAIAGVIFLLFYVGFGILAGIWPFHTWSPDGHDAAPAAGSMMHAGVLMKLGAYGVLRLGFQLLPDAAHEWAWLVGTVAVINIVYGAVAAGWQTDIKYLIAYSSVSHMGIVMLGMATLAEPGIAGSVFQMVAHGIMTALLFTIVNMVYHKSHTRDMTAMGGFAGRMPGMAFFFVLAGLSSLGLPGLAGFVAEFLVFLGAWQSAHGWWLFPAVIGAFITAIYVMRAAARIFFGPERPEFSEVRDAHGVEWVTLVVLGGLLVVFGFYPRLLLDSIHVGVGELLLGWASDMNWNAIGLETGLLALSMAVLTWDLTLGHGRSALRKGHFVIASIGLAVLLVVSFRLETPATFTAALVLDEFALFAKQVILAAGLLTVLATYPYADRRGWSSRSGEFLVLLLFAMIGGMALVSAREFLTLFVAFELLSLPLYSLAAIEKTRPESPEGAMKIFLFGSVSSAVMLLGIGMLFASTGTTFWLEAPADLDGSLMGLGVLLLLVGFGFKIAMFPFYMWVPDTYDAAPTPIVAFLSVAPKAAGIGALFRLYFELFSSHVPAVTLWIGVLAALTMIAGNLLALPQTKLKRLLAYSGVAQIGYVLLAVASGSGFGAGMALFFFVAYLFSNIGAFLCVAAVEAAGEEPTLFGVRNLVRRSPVLAAAFLVFLLSLGGIPFALGFWGKMYVFLAAGKAGLWGLVFLGAVLAVVALYYYLNVARWMFMVHDRGPRLTVPLPIMLAILICVLVVVGGGLVPRLFVEPALRAVTGL